MNSKCLNKQPKKLKQNTNKQLNEIKETVQKKEKFKKRYRNHEKESN
jgi:hypothetical protein